MFLSNKILHFIERLIYRLVIFKTATASGHWSPTVFCSHFTSLLFVCLFLGVGTVYDGVGLRCLQNCWWPANCRQAAAVNMHGGAGLGRGQVWIRYVIIINQQCLNALPESIIMSWYYRLSYRPLIIITTTISWSPSTISVHYSSYLARSQRSAEKAIKIGGSLRF